MSTSPSHPEQYDDFRLIPGIGAGIEKRLHNAHIRTYSELAAKTPQDLAKILHGIPGKTGASAELKEWIQYAGQLAREQELLEAIDEPDEESLKENPSTESKTRYENFTIELHLGEGGQVYRTRVTHLQDGHETAWPGWRGPNLLAFIQEHAKLLEEIPTVANAGVATRPVAEQSQEREIVTAVEEVPANPNVRNTPRIMPGFSVAVTKMEVRTLEKPIPSHLLKSGEPFDIYLGLDLSRVDRPNGTVVDYSAELYAHELNTSARQKIAAGQGKVVLAKPADIEIHGDPLPPGFYRFEAYITLASPVENGSQIRRAAFWDGGLFQVD